MTTVEDLRRVGAQRPDITEPMDLHRQAEWEAMAAVCSEAAKWADSISSRSARDLLAALARLERVRRGAT